MDSEEIRKKALDMRLSGVGYSAIAEKLNIPISRVHTIVKAGVAFPTSKKLIETERAVSATRLDMAYALLAEAMCDATNRELTAFASSIVSLEARRARLLGLDAETEIAQETAGSNEAAAKKAQDAINTLIGHVGPKDK